MSIRSIIIIILVWLLVAYIRQQLNREKPAAPKKSESKPGILPSDTIKCAHCGTYIPQRESVKVEDHYYCSEEHARLGSDS